MFLNVNYYFNDVNILCLKQTSTFTEKLNFMRKINVLELFDLTFLNDYSLLLKFLTSNVTSFVTTSTIILG